MSTSTEAPQPTSVRKIMVAGAIGTAVEWYDYFIYGIAAALVLNQLFFPAVSPTIGTLAAFASFAVGFLARPVGAAVFGHFGDRYGRKRMLVLSLTIMGVATVGMGLLPTHASIGIWAPVLLVTLRLLQGFAVGGEWGGATVLATEYASTERRGFVGSIVQLGSPAGLLMASGAFSLVSFLPEDQLLSWGWRVPFLASAVLVAIGLYIRLNILESPEFQRAESANEKVRLPGAEVFRTSWRSLLVAMGARFAPDIGFYICGTFIVSYAADQLGMSTSGILSAVTVAAAVELVTVPYFGWLSDRVGRRAVYLGGALFWVVFAFPFFWLVDTQTTALVWIGVLLAFAVGHASMWAVAAALYAELFPTRVRYSGASLGYQLSIVVGGGPAPFVATALVAWSAGASWPVSVYLLGAGAISFASLLVSKETYRTDLALERQTVGIDAVGQSVAAPVQARSR